MQIYNTLTGKKAPLEPLEPGKVRLYVCGITVYDFCHIGHARMAVVFDMVSRWLRVAGYDLTYVRNTTDIDDKIIKRADEVGESITALSERFIEAMNEDFERLGIIRPDAEPRATRSMPAILTMIETLIEKGHAYAADNGDVYYDVSTFDGYGKLSGKKVDDLRSGARVDVNEAKDDPLDFVLWKAAKAGEPAWESPWGQGRPGWHIECSAMATECLGDTFDIHGGGVDLKFPHHENEIAQSEGATDAPFATTWMHNGFVNVDNEKMSKSLGNFFTIRDVLKRYRGEEIRAFILLSHYRSPVNYSDASLDAARAALTRLYTAMRGIDPTIATPRASLPPVLAERGGASGGSGAPRRDSLEDFQRRFFEAMNDDFNTPVAFAVLFDLAREVNRLRDENPAAASAHVALMRELGGHLGFLQDDPDAYLRGQGAAGGLDDTAIEALIEQRTAARKAKDFAESDRIRDELAAAGITLEDGAAGTTWRRGQNKVPDTE
ncbi:MAG: cysteine--tRNA ligase [Gammaproteobacteria bacterium]